MKAQAQFTISHLSDGATGATGVGISSISEKYAVSSSNSTAPTTWYDTVQTMTATNKFLWNYEIITYTNNTTKTTAKRVIGVYGDKGNTGSTGNTGATGNGISSVVNYYLATASSSGVTASTSGWTTTIQNVTATKKYLWNYEVINYTNGGNTTTTPCMIGAYGDKGNTGATGSAGVGIQSTVVSYQASTSGTTAPTGTWSTTVPSVAQSQYLWTRTEINYTNNTKSTAYSVGRMGANGATGSTGPQGATGAAGSNGVSVLSVDVEYYLSTSATALSGGSWSTSTPTWTSGKYIWSRTRTLKSDSANYVYSNPACITGQKGQTGNTGNTGATGNGISKVEELYAKTTSKISIPADSLFSAYDTSKHSWSPGSYIWTATRVSYTNGTVTIVGKSCDSSWDAIDNVTVSSRNLIKGGKCNKVYGFVSYFDKVTDEYGEFTLTSKNTLVSKPLTNGFVIAHPDYPLNTYYTWSFDIKCTKWDFPEGTTLGEWWMGQRYGIGGATTEDNYMGVTQISLPNFGSAEYELDTWYTITKTIKTPVKSYTDKRLDYLIQLYNANADISASVTIQMKNVQLVRGTKVGDFVPAQEDVTTDISSGIKMGLIAKKNYNGYYTVNNGEIFFHGYSDELCTKPADVEGWFKWNNTKYYITKTYLNPQACPMNQKIYIASSLSSSKNLFSFWYDYINKAWKYSSQTNTTINDLTLKDDQILLGEFIMSEPEMVKSCDLYDSPRSFTAMLEEQRRNEELEAAKNELEEVSNTVVYEKDYIETANSLMTQISETNTVISKYKEDNDTAVTEVTKRIGTIEKKADSMTASFGTYKSITDGRVDNTEKAIEEYRTNIRLSADGIDIGKSNTEFHSKFTEKKLSFMQGDNERTYIDKDGLKVPEKADVGKELSIGGKYVFTIGTSGHLNLLIN